MSVDTNKVYEWAIIGAGPAGLATVGLLIDSGINPDDMAIIDPAFTVGDFGAYWGEVYSNTTVENFLEFLSQIQSFKFSQQLNTFDLESMPKSGFCQLKKVSEVLQWVTGHLEQSVSFHYDKAVSLNIFNGCWQINLDQGKQLQSKQVVLATGADPKTLSFPNVKEINLYYALNPKKLTNMVASDDIVAVFGSSHSSMIIIKNLLDVGVKKVVNFYLTPHRYAVNMGDWTLYDNTGLKGLTAEWVHKNISQHLDSRIERYISNDQNIKKHMNQCNKGVYPIGFKPRSLDIKNTDVKQYDPHTGIIAPGLFGVGIAFPQVVIDPFGNKEFNVGLNKFMRDIKKVLPIWKKYHI